LNPSVFRRGQQPFISARVRSSSADSIPNAQGHESITRLL
jgi:hypothetical protein